ncbi:MAG: hypothetical protein EBV93_05360, partial [Actinobacteria bacterium]|nr:hypothetical protein [Actinomycetota bacterium]
MQQTSSCCMSYRLPMVS